MEAGWTPLSKATGKTGRTSQSPESKGPSLQQRLRRALSHRELPRKASTRSVSRPRRLSSLHMWHPWGTGFPGHALRRGLGHGPELEAAKPNTPPSGSDRTDWEDARPANTRHPERDDLLKDDLPTGSAFS